MQNIFGTRKACSFALLRSFWKGLHFYLRSSWHTMGTLYGKIFWGLFETLKNIYCSFFQHKPLTTSVPCLKCTQPRYCSESCRSLSWSTYHQYECSGLDLLHSVGIAHLGLRVVLVTGLSHLLKFRQGPNQKTAPKVDIDSENQGKFKKKLKESK